MPGAAQEHGTGGFGAYQQTRVLEEEIGNGIKPPCQTGLIVSSDRFVLLDTLSPSWSASIIS